MKIGVQTFTIRKQQKRSMRRAYAALAEVEVRALELARIDHSSSTAERLSALLPSLGIEPVSLQIKPKYIFGDMEGVVAFCSKIGCKNVVISMLPLSCLLFGEEKFYRFIDSLDEWFERYAKKGITLAYHHHNWEYNKRLSNGKTRMEELLSRTQKIKFVCDTYWTAKCGISPAEQIRAFGERLLGVHLRDLAPHGGFLGLFASDCAIGRGVIDFGAVLGAAHEVGAEYAVVEQNSSMPYLDLAFSLANLNKILTETEIPL